MKLLKLATLLFLLFMYGCASLNFSNKEKEIMESWVGHSKAELIRSWGPPNRTTNDGQGGEILIYDRSMNFGQTPGTVYTQAYSNNVYYTSPQTNVITRSRMFYINKEGRIYYWRCEGRKGY